MFLSQPPSMTGVDSFGGLGATLVDSLDTLFIMGLDTQFKRAREWVLLILLHSSSFCIVGWLPLKHLILEVLQVDREIIVF